MRIAASVVALLVLFVSIAPAQRDPQRPRDQKPATASPPDNPVEPPQTELETIKIDTNLVTVPVIASARNGLYISDLRKEEFQVSEDGVPQEIAFLATVNAPFYVVLMMDTSNSTRDQLPQIQRAASAFLDQLGPRDKVKIISFDDELHDWNEFTSDKVVLRGVIGQMRPGHNTRVYDAVQMAFDSLRPIQQRKAIVIFSDGMDYHSQSSTFEGTLHDLDESGVIVYPIRFDTRVDTERLARQQEAEQGGVQLPTSSIIRQPPAGTTPSTFPSDESSPVPARTRTPSTLPNLSDILGRRRDPNPPGTGSPTDPFPDPRGPSTRTPPNPGTIRDRPKNDTISGMLDNLYLMADSYLKEIADRSGGQIYRADNVAMLPQAFAAIAAELRTQYLLGYYPTNRTHDSVYRKIQVKTSRKDIAIRARPGYRARRGR